MEAPFETTTTSIQWASLALSVVYLGAISACVVQYKRVLYWLVYYATAAEIQLRNRFQDNAVKDAPPISKGEVVHSNIGFVSFPAYFVKDKRYIMVTRTSPTPGDEVDLGWYTELMRNKRVSSMRDGPRIIRADMFLALKDDPQEKPLQYNITKIMQMFYGVYRDFHHNVSEMCPPMKVMNPRPYTVFLYMYEIERTFGSDPETLAKFSWENIEKMVIFYDTSDHKQYRARPDECFYSLDPFEMDEVSSYST